MFEARLNSIDLLRDSIGTICEMIDEAELHITEAGMHMTATDRAVVVVVDFFMSRNAFDAYTFSDETKVGINLLNFMQIMRRALPDDKLEIKLHENKIELVLSGNSTRKFVMPIIDISKEEIPPLDKFDFSANVKINGETMNNGIEDAELVADSVVLTMRKDMFVLKAESDSASSQLEVTQGDNMKIIDIGEPVRARFSLDYLKKIFKARKLADDAILFSSTDYPMKIIFDVPGKMRLGFILAPRVEE